MRAVVFGAGKIARGFIGQLLYRSGFSTTFIDVNRKLVDDLNSRGRYYVNVMGNPEECEWITNFEMLSLDDEKSIAKNLLDADVAFTSVGGKNLGSIAKVVANAYLYDTAAWEGKLLTIVTCENWKNPGKLLRESIVDLCPEELRSEVIKHIEVSEAAILRSGVEPTEEVLCIDPNAVSVTDYWTLHVDADHWTGKRIALKGIQYMDHFDSFLQRKIYTFNSSNATIAYIGRLKGYKYLADAANDPEIVDLLHAVVSELNLAISKTMNVSPEEQQNFSMKAQLKYQDRSVTDFVERHARDPIRKLGPNDRIVGTARLIEQAGGRAQAIALTLAAAIYYTTENLDDPSAALLAQKRSEGGVESILEDVCHIESGEMLFTDTLTAVAELKRRGWI